MAARKNDPFGGKIQNPNFYVDKEKGAVKLRTRERANGCFVIYFDKCYKGKKRECEIVKDSNGQPLYLVPENGRNDSVNKNRNRKTWETAKARKAELIVFGQSTEKEKAEALKGASLLNFIRKCYEEEKEANKPGKGLRFRTLHAQMEAFADGQEIVFAQVDKPFVLRFIDFLKNKAVFTFKHKTADSRPRISPNTQVQIMRTFSVVLSKAVDAGILEVNPYFQIDKKKKIHREKTRINFLTVEEVQRLIDTPCKWEVMKRAFLFSCSTGLRYSDVSRLTWGDIQNDEVLGKVMKIRVQKTSREEIFPVPTPALHVLPERNGAPDNGVIFPLKYNHLLGEHLQKWVDDAGINKKIRFHSSRHTMATISLHLGAPIETVSKLLGHTEIRTTEIYAEVLDESKKKAVALQDNIFKF